MIEVIETIIAADKIIFNIMASPYRRRFGRPFGLLLIQLRERPRTYQVKENIGAMSSEAHRLDSEYSASLVLRKLNPHESLET